MRFIFNFIAMILGVIFTYVLTGQEPTAGESLILGTLVGIFTNQVKILEILERR